MTEAQINAVNWLRARGGDGLFDLNGVLVAHGERAPFMRSTWNTLGSLGYIEFYNTRGGQGRGRLRLTQAADSVPRCDVNEYGEAL